jgi:hypothetical protein
VDNSTFPNQHLFDQFIKEKQFLDGVSLETVRAYTEGWRSFNRHGKAELSESGVKDFRLPAVALRDKVNSIRF